MGPRFFVFNSSFISSLHSKSNLCKSSNESTNHSQINLEITVNKLLIIFTISILTSPATLNAQIILNEYNAVSGSKHLDEDLFADSDQADTTFGRIEGNGGNWFELLVIGNESSSVVDMRGWQLSWTEEDEVSPGVNAQGTITLSNDNFWSAIERGTILTFIETADGGGVPGISTATDVSFDKSTNDWHMNFSTTQEQATGSLLTTTTNDGVAGEFSVGNDNWQLTISDSLGNVVAGPTGEGDGNLSGVSSREVGKLEGLVSPNATLVDWLALDLASAPYNDGSSSSFGKANVFSAGTETQDLSALRVQAVLGDVNQDGAVNFLDISPFIGYLSSGLYLEEADIDQNNTVNFLDISPFISLLSAQ